MDGVHVPRGRSRPPIRSRVGDPSGVYVFATGRRLVALLPAVRGWRVVGLAGARGHGDLRLLRRSRIADGRLRVRPRQRRRPVRYRRLSGGLGGLGRASAAGVTSDPAAASRSDRASTCSCGATTDAVWLPACGGGAWSGWQPLGGAATAVAGGDRRLDGRLRVRPWRRRRRSGPASRRRTPGPGGSPLGGPFAPVARRPLSACIDARSCSSAAVAAGLLAAAGPAFAQTVGNPVGNVSPTVAAPSGRVGAAALGSPVDDRVAVLIRNGSTKTGTRRPRHVDRDLEGRRDGGEGPQPGGVPAGAGTRGSGAGVGEVPRRRRGTRRGDHGEDPQHAGQTGARGAGADRGWPRPVAAEDGLGRADHDRDGDESHPLVEGPVTEGGGDVLRRGHQSGGGGDGRASPSTVWRPGSRLRSRSRCPRSARPTWSPPAPPNVPRVAVVVGFLSSGW